MGECTSPYCISNKLKKQIMVPCGKCPACQARRISHWSFRLLQELKVSLSAHFVTLTYATKNLPLVSSGAATLSKRDLQLFFKRLRKALGRSNIKYYAAGEYGEQTRRPHYHIILFGATEKSIVQAWGLGKYYFGTVSGSSIGYTLKYIYKSHRFRKIDANGIQPEFSLMSKGIGASYLTKAMKAWHMADLESRMYCNIEGGKKIGMPRYYRLKLYSDEQRTRIIESVARKIYQADIKLFNANPRNYIRNKMEARHASIRKRELDTRKFCNNKI